MTIKRCILICIGLLCMSSIAFNQQTIKPSIESESGDFYGSDTQYGVVLTSPNGTPFRIKVVSDGTVVTDNQQPVAPLIESESGDFYGKDYRYGVVLTSPSGTCYRIRVLDDGEIITEIVDCPNQVHDCIDIELSLENDALGAQNSNITHGDFTGVSGWTPAKAGDNNSTRIILDGSDNYSAGEIYPLTTTETRAKVSYMMMLEEDWMPVDGLILPGFSAIDYGPAIGGLGTGGAGYGDGNVSMPVNQQKSWSARGFISRSNNSNAANALGSYIYHSNHSTYPEGDRDWWGNGLIETLPQQEARLIAGQWHNIEQEVILNDIGQSNGVLRGWLDGTLLYERTNLHFTDNPAYRTIAFNTNTNKPQDNSDQASDILFGPWVQPYSHKGQDGTWPVVTNDPYYKLNWMHMHRSQLNPNDAFYIIDLIEDARSAGMKMSLQIGEEAMYGINKVFKWNLWTAMIDQVAAGPEGIAIQEGIDDGTIETIYLMDEPHTQSHWNPRVQSAIVDDMGQYVKSKWPNAKTSVRAPLLFIESVMPYHDFQYVDYSYITWSFNQWSTWSQKLGNGQPNRHSTEWHWERNFKPYANQSLMKPRVMLQQGRGPEYAAMRTWTPHGYFDSSFDWFEETGAGEAQLGDDVLNDVYTYYTDSPDNMDYGAMGALQKRDPITGALDPINGKVLIDCIGLFRWDREGGNNPDSGPAGNKPLPYTDTQVIRDTYFNIRDKVAAGPPYVARLIERHPEWAHELDPDSSYDPSATVPTPEECEIFLDCLTFVIGDDCN